jgi:uncharacterized protein (DUF1015 family)
MRATRTHISQVFGLYRDPERASEVALGDVEASPPILDGTTADGCRHRLWAVTDARAIARVAEVMRGKQILIADGHHRYETALAYHAEVGTPESGRMLVVLVSTSDPGLEIFPTHRVFSGRPELVPSGHTGDLGEMLARLAAEPYDRSVAVAYSRTGAVIVHGELGELDVELVDRYGHDGIGYTPDVGEAVRRVEAGEADVAFLLRATRIEDVFARARRGEVMPQKTTYFFPKLLSGLLFMPLEP